MFCSKMKVYHTTKSAKTSLQNTYILLFFLEKVQYSVTIKYLQDKNSCLESNSVLCNVLWLTLFELGNQVGQDDPQRYFSTSATLWAYESTYYFEITFTLTTLHGPIYHHQLKKCVLGLVSGIQIPHCLKRNPHFSCWL